MIVRGRQQSEVTGRLAFHDVVVWLNLSLRIVDFDELAYQLPRPKRLVPYDAGLVERHRDRYDLNIEQIERVDIKGPIQLAPLSIEFRSVGVLLLDNSQNL